MSHIRSKATKPELAVRRWLWSHGYRYRLNVKSVPGKPDIVMRPYRTAIFVNGCFWHGHGIVVGTPCGGEDDELQTSGSKCCKIPSSNRDFWVSKIRRNQERDQRNYAVLKENGWQVIVVWECELKPAAIERTMRRVDLLLNENFLSIHRRHAVVSYTTCDEDGELPMAAEELM